MTITSKPSKLLSLCAATAVAAVAIPAPALADPSPTPTAKSTVVFEVTGTGSVYTIDTDPGVDRVYDAQLPWRSSTTIGPDVQLLQVVAVGKDSPGPGCRITLDGTVVAEQPVGGSAHCIYSRS